VSDVLVPDVCVVEAVVFAAEAEFVALPLQAMAAMAAMAIETRTERYIFPSCGQR
jgi:hypothetical protein